MRILYTGDIVGSPGRRVFLQQAPLLRDEFDIDAVVCNAENSAGGRGITPAIGEALLSGGADVLTMGDHTWDQRDVGPYLDEESRIIRPANFDADTPGRGMTTISTEAGSITVIQVIGRVFMQPHYACPFRTADRLVQAAAQQSKVILVEIHAEATSEKIALGRYLEGRVSAVVGSHTHVQTSDDCVLAKGTAYLTDLGMTGPKDSVLGRDVESVTRRFLTGMPTRFDVASDDIKLEGAVIDIDARTGKATSIQRIRRDLDS